MAITNRNALQIQTLFFNVYPPTELDQTKLESLGDAGTYVLLVTQDWELLPKSTDFQTELCVTIMRAY